MSRTQKRRERFYHIRTTRKVEQLMGEEPRDIYREEVDRTWSNMKRQHFPSYVFREGVEPVAYQVFVGEDSEFIHEACAKDIWDREFPLYEDDVDAARNLEPIHCLRCDGLIAEAKEALTV